MDHDDVDAVVLLVADGRGVVAQEAERDLPGAGDVGGFAEVGEAAASRPAAGGLVAADGAGAVDAAVEGGGQGLRAREQYSGVKSPVLPPAT